MEPLITVIVPVYNVEAYLPRCVESIIKQTYHNIEIILVDDGSTDNSGSLCDEFAKKDKRILVIHQKNAGISAARNSALDLAKGEYIAFIDSDDYISEHMISTLYEKLEQTKADMAICNYHKWLENEEKLLKSKLSIDDKVVTKEEAFEFLFCEELSVFMPVAWNKLYRRKLWQELRYPKGRCHEDEYVIHHVLEGCSRVAIVPEEMYYYRIRSGSIMATRAISASRDFVNSLLDRRSFFEEKGYKELERRQREQCIRLILWECKKRNNMDSDTKKFIYEMSKEVRILLKNRKIKGCIGAKIFARMPLFYIRCSSIL